MGPPPTVRTIGGGSPLRYGLTPLHPRASPPRPPTFLLHFECLRSPIAATRPYLGASATDSEWAFRRRPHAPGEVGLLPLFDGNPKPM